MSTPRRPRHTPSSLSRSSSAPGNLTHTSPPPSSPEMAGLLNAPHQSGKSRPSTPVRTPGRNSLATTRGSLLNPSATLRGSTSVNTIPPGIPPVNTIPPGIPPVNTIPPGIPPANSTLPGSTHSTVTATPPAVNRSLFSKIFPLWCSPAATATANPNPQTPPPNPNPQTQTGFIGGLKDRIQRDHWTSSLHVKLRREVLSNQLGLDLTLRFWAGRGKKRRNPANWIYTTFKPFMKRRDLIDTKLDVLRSSCRTRGSFMIAGQLVAGGSIFLPFVSKNFENPEKKFVGLGAYYAVMMVVGILIGLSLNHLLKEFKEIEYLYDDSINDTKIMIDDHDLICPDGDTYIVTAKDFMIEDSIVSKLLQICCPLDFGFFSYKLVWIEMGVASVVFVSVPLIATLTRLGF